MDFLRVPGAALLGGDKLIFDEIKINVDKATNDYLIRPDWDANLRCVELISPISNQELLGEVSLMLRKKLRSFTPKVVFLTLRLMESLVNNCKVSWYMALNDERNTRELANVARTYSKRTGPENREVAETALDIIQAWGEAFLTRQKQFPNIVQLYFDLRKEGLPFKVNNQFDPNRVPIFNSAPSSSSGLPRDNTDAILAAAMESADISRERSHSRGGERARSYTANYQNSTTRSRQYSNSDPYQSQQNPNNNLSPNEIIETMATSINLLKDLILTCFNARDLQQNEIADEIAAQLQSVQGNVSGAIEAAMSDPEALDALFQVNDQAQTLLQVFKNMKDGRTTLEEGKKTLFPEDTAKKVVAAPQPEKSATTTNLLDYDNSSVPSPSKPSSGKNPLRTDLLSSPPAKPQVVVAAPVSSPQMTTKANVVNINSKIVSPSDDPFGPSSSSAASDDPFGPSSVDPFADFKPQSTTSASGPSSAPAQQGKGGIDLDALFGSTPVQPAVGFYPQAQALPTAYPPSMYTQAPYPPQPYGYPPQPYPIQSGLAPAPMYPTTFAQPSNVNSSFPAPASNTQSANINNTATNQQNNPFDIFE